MGHNGGWKTRDKSLGSVATCPRLGPIAPMDLDRLLNEIIPYRMQALDTLILAMRSKETAWDPNILKGCRLAVPPSIHALRRTPAPTSLEMSLAAGGACHHRDRVREINDGMSAFEAKADMR